MAVYEVRFAREADADFDAITDYIAADSPVRAISFVQELRSRTQKLLSASPNIGASVGMRRYVVFGRYVVVYRVDDDAHVVHIQLVTEGHRDWRRLLEGLA